MRRTRTLTTALAVTPLLVAASVTAANATPTHHAVHTAVRGHHPSPQIARAVRRQIASRGSARVIVELRGSAATAHPDTPRGQRAHTAAVTRAQQPVLALLHGGSRASAVHAYSTFDAISARVTRAGLAKLAASSDVAVVAPDATLKLTPDAETAPTATAPKPVEAKPVTPPGGVCTSKAQLAPEALQTTDTASDDPDAKTARSLGATGAGVTVAFMAEGIDVNNPDFIRPDGTPVFTDYQDFSGDGTSAPTDAGEAFIDAGSIAAQGNKTYNVAHYSDLPDKSACRIRVEGISPGASLVDLKVFGDNELASASGFLEAIDYAVDVDHVDVLSQSFGSNPVPDTTMDVIRTADEAAVAAGTTVVASSGDAGVTNTIGSPATSPGVISAGATTTYRFDLQSGYGGGRLPGVKGYLSNNISSLSSSGTDQAGATVDLVAPGELNWGLCTADIQQYFDCTSLAGNPSNLEDAGGTSESAPLVAGGAALVIQAYRQTHSDTSPSPAVVRQLLVSTARDISAPGDQQGAGELDTYRAVLAARSIAGSSVTPTANGDTFVTDTGQIDVTGAANTAVTRTVTVTNTGVTAQTITPSVRTLGTYSAFSAHHVTLKSSTPTLIDWQGYRDPYKKVTFTVPSGVDRLDASIAYQAASSDLDARGRLDLIGPHGALAAYSLPQGIGNYGDVQVTRPKAGRWTAYIYTRPAAAGGSLGRYVFGFRTAKFVTAGQVTGPITLQPGRSGTIGYSSTTPTTPGDQASSIVLSSPDGTTTIPVILRSLVPISTAGTPFTGLLTGGNGRDTNTGQGEYYQFDVASGTPQLNATIKLSKTADPTFVSLIDPNGDQVGYGSNEFLASLSADPNPQLSAVAHVLTPAEGRWTMFVDFAPVVSGTALSQSFSVLVNTAASSVTPTGLPNANSTMLPAGSPYTADVAVTNTTSEPEAYFADARTGQSVTYPLIGYDTTMTLPLTDSEPTWLVPSRTTSVTTSVSASKTAEFDWGPAFGDPDLESNGSGLNPTGTYTAPVVTPGGWYAAPSQLGPYGAVGSPHATATASMTATTAGFDRTVTSSTNDLWLDSIDAAASDVKPVVVQPGKTGVIAVHITPTGTSGSVVSGTVYIDDLAAFTPYGTSPSADEVAALPYRYTIG